MSDLPDFTRQISVTTVPGAMHTGSKILGTADECLVTGSVPCKAVSVQADESNTGFIFVDGVTEAGSKHYKIGPGRSVDFSIDNLNKIHVSGSQADQRVNYLYVH